MMGTLEFWIILFVVLAAAYGAARFVFWRNDIATQRNKRAAISRAVEANIRALPANLRTEETKEKLRAQVETPVRIKFKDIKLPPKQQAEYNYLRSRGYSKSRALEKLMER